MLRSIACKYGTHFIDHALFHNRHQISPGDDCQLIITGSRGKCAIADVGIVTFQVIGSSIARAGILTGSGRARSDDNRYHVIYAVNTQLSRRFTVDKRLVGLAVLEIRRQGIPQSFTTAVPRVIESQYGKRQSTQRCPRTQRTIRFRPAVVIAVGTG